MAAPGDPWKCRLSRLPTFPKAHQILFDSSEMDNEDFGNKGIFSLQMEDCIVSDTSWQLDFMAVGTSLINKKLKPPTKNKKGWWT